MHLQIDRGVVSGLKIVRIQENILFSPKVSEQAFVSEWIFAIAQLSAEEVRTLGNASEYADAVDIYSFELNNVQYVGVTRKASFKNGDEVDLVYESGPNGLGVIGLRRPSTRSMWMYPYMSCGSSATILRGIDSWLKWGTASAVILLLIISIGGLVTGARQPTVKEVMWFFFISYSLSLLGVSWLLPRLFVFSKAADKVFAEMGFEQPKKVNLLVISNAYRKKNGTIWHSAELWY